MHLALNYAEILAFPNVSDRGSKQRFADQFIVAYY